MHVCSCELKKFIYDNQQYTIGSQLHLTVSVCHKNKNRDNKQKLYRNLLCIRVLWNKIVDFQIGAESNDLSFVQYLIILGTIVVVIVWQLGILTSLVISAYHSIQHYVIKCVSDLRQVGGFLWVLRFPLPIKLTTLTLTIIILRSNERFSQKVQFHCLKIGGKFHILLSRKQTMQLHRKGQTDTNNDLQSTIQNIKDGATRIPQIWGELMSSERVCCSSTLLDS